MPLIAKNGTVESRVQRDFGMDFVRFMAKCHSENIPIGKVAEMICCSASNLHRILRKHKIDYSKATPIEPMFNTDSLFQCKRINTVNCLSRRWVA